MQLLSHITAIFLAQGFDFISVALANQLQFQPDIAARLLRNTASLYQVSNIFETPALSRLQNLAKIASHLHGQKMLHWNWVAIVCFRYCHLRAQQMFMLEKVEKKRLFSTTWKFIAPGGGSASLPGSLLCLVTHRTAASCTVQQLLHGKLHENVARFIWRLERFSIECRKTKTKVITPTKHKNVNNKNGPIRTRSKFM